MNVYTKPTMQMVTDKIKSVTYTRLPAGTAIVCEIQLHNLHTCHGIAVVVDMDNDNVEMGKKTAYDKAVTGVFEVVAYELHCQMVPMRSGFGPQLGNRNQELQEAHQAAHNNQPISV